MATINILVADNDPNYRASLVEDILKPEGFAVFQAENRQQALRILKEQLIHIAILDIRLEDDDDPSDQSGIEVYEEIDPIVARVLLTGYPPQGVESGMFPNRLGVSLGGRYLETFVLSKKANPPELLEAVRRLLKEEFEIISKRRIAVLTSGGDSPGMNAAIRAIVRTAMANHVEVLGVYDGYRGLVQNRMSKLRWNGVSDIIQLGGTILRTSRYPEFRSDSVREPAVEVIEHKHISGVVVIGGDGSMKGAQVLANDLRQRDYQLQIIGLPGTIDNDILGTDMSLGAASAANAMIHEFNNMLRPAQALRRIFIGEVMGRYSGYLALQAALGVGADAALLPEKVVKIDPPVSDGDTRPWRARIAKFETQALLRRKLDEIAETLEHGFRAGKAYGFIVLAEGIDQLTRDEDLGIRLNGEFVRRYLENQIVHWPIKPDIETVTTHSPDREIDWEMEPPPDVRAHVLGYPVRGVSPCRFDVFLGGILGVEAVNALLAGKTDIMLGWQRRKQEITETPISQVVTLSDRPPEEIWQDRPEWSKALEHLELLACPPAMYRLSSL